MRYKTKKIYVLENCFVEEIKTILIESQNDVQIENFVFSWVSDGCRKHGSDDEVDSSQIGGFGGIWYVSCVILVDFDMIYLL